MQVKQRWMNVWIVTPQGLFRRDLLIDGEPDRGSG